jgi:hypothetical protein
MMQNYSLDELRDISEHGCVSGCATGLIYYSDTLAFYDKYCEELHEVISQDCEDFGETPKYLTDALAQGCTSFKNAVVWYVAESYAFELVNQAVDYD